MLKKTKFIAMSILSIVMCSSLIAGATYALFTSDSTTNIAITSGKVDVQAHASQLVGSSLGKASSDDTSATPLEFSGVDASYNGLYSYTAATAIENETDAVKFSNGGTAKLNGNKITLDRITPGDKVTFNLNVVNYSNVTVNYRIRFFCESEIDATTEVVKEDYALFDALNIEVPLIDANGDKLDYVKGSQTGILSYATAWKQLTAASDSTNGDSLIESKVTIELPITIGNTVQNRHCEVYYVVEAVQGNAALNDDQVTTTYIDSSRTGATKVQSVNTAENATGTTVTLKNAVIDLTKDVPLSEQTDTTTVSVSIPTAATTGAQSVSVSVNSTTVDDINKTLNTDKTISVDAGSTVYAFDVDAKAGTTEVGTVEDGHYVISFKVDNTLTADDLTVYHKDTQLFNNTEKDEYFTYENGTVTVYTKSLSPFVISYFYGGGNGNVDNPYKIYTVAQLQRFALSVNGGKSYSKQYVSLENNLNLNNIDWTPIGTDSTHSFEGTFNGNDNIISNLYINNNTLTNVGLFGRTANATIQNIKIANANVTGESCVGALIGNAFTGTVKDCEVSGKINITGYYMVGGIAGSGYSRFENITLKGLDNYNNTIIGNYLMKDLEGDCVGGIVGFTGEKNNVGTIVNNCSVENISTIEGSRKIGGVVGYLHYNCQATNDTVKNVNIKTNATETYINDNPKKVLVGGIVGEYSGYINQGMNVMISGTLSDVTITGLTDLTGLAAGGTRSGYKLQTSVDISGTIIINGSKVESVVQIENNKGVEEETVVKYYATLQEAVNAAVVTKDDYGYYSGDMIVITKNITAESETIIEISKPIIIYVEVENTENLITNIKLKISENAGDVILMFVGVDPRNLMDDNDKYDFDDGEVIEYKPSYCFVTLKVTESV